MDVATVVAKRIDDLNLNIRSLITIYMQWYIFYWTLNTGALAWFWLGNGALATGNRSLAANAVTVFFALMGVPSAVSSFMVLRAVLGMRSEIERLNQELISSVKDERLQTAAPLLQAATWPKRVTVWGLWVNGLTTLALAVIWLL